MISFFRRTFFPVWIIFVCATAPLTALADKPAAGIDESTFVPIGGIEQWISIRGQNRDNPVLLVGHGGPGEPQWPAADRYAPWEKAFTFVQWDQRGAGHTYGRYGEKTPEVTLDRIARDGVEVANYLCDKLGKKKLIVLGHSWGSLVAIRMVQLAPSRFAAYVGTGQVASWSASVNFQYEALLAKARRDHDEAATKELEAIVHPDPNDSKQYFSFTKNLRAVMAPADQAWLKSLRENAPRLMASHPKDFQDLIDGMNFTGSRVLPDQIETNLPKTARRLDTAIFLIQGRDDIITPTQAAVDYVDGIQAPFKKIFLIPNAGHFAFMTSSSEFLVALVHDVRPVAIASGA